MSGCDSPMLSSRSIPFCCCVCLPYACVCMLFAFCLHRLSLSSLLLLLCSPFPIPAPIASPSLQRRRGAGVLDARVGRPAGPPRVAQLFPWPWWPRRTRRPWPWWTRRPWRWPWRRPRPRWRRRPQAQPRRRRRRRPCSQARQRGQRPRRLSVRLRLCCYGCNYWMQARQPWGGAGQSRCASYVDACVSRSLQSGALAIPINNACAQMPAYTETTALRHAPCTVPHCASQSS